MPAPRKVLMLPGDGIGPEVMFQVRRVMEWLAKRRSVNFEVREGLVGGASIDAHGTPLTDEVMADAMSYDAVLLGAVGGPKWDGVARHLRPEAGLLRLRKEMDLFANLRPAFVYDCMAQASSLKPELVKGLDLIIVRELTAGVYFGQPRGIETLASGVRRAVDTQVYTEIEVNRVVRVAFDLAQHRTKKIHSVEKANVMETGVFWREIATKIGKEYPSVQLHHMYADNCAMQLVRNPKQFDIIVTDNLFGDLLSDCAAMLTGSLGMLPSASLGAPDASGRRRAMYEPVHGSAPDIAGADTANPVAMLLSFCMMLRWSYSLHEEAGIIEGAIEKLLASGMRTADVMVPNAARVSTRTFVDMLMRELDKAIGLA
jgi:3-isopropylmalate dehydrogenase